MMTRDDRRAERPPSLATVSHNTHHGERCEPNDTTVLHVAQDNVFGVPVTVLQSDYHDTPLHCTSTETRLALQTIDGYTYAPSCHDYRDCRGCRMIKATHLTRQIAHELTLQPLGYTLVSDDEWDAWRKREGRAVKRGEVLRCRRLKIPQPHGWHIVVAPHPEPARQPLPLDLGPELYDILKRVPRGREVGGVPTARRSVVKRGQQKRWGGPHHGAWPRAKSPHDYLPSGLTIDDTHKLLVGYRDAYRLDFDIVRSNNRLDWSAMPEEHRFWFLMTHLPKWGDHLDRRSDTGQTVR